MDQEKQAPQKSKLWTWDFIKVGIARIFSSCSIQVIQTIFPIFLDARGFSATSIGTVASLYTTSGMVMRFASGRIVDTAGRRKVGLLGSALFGIGLLGCMGAVFFEDRLSATFRLPGGSAISIAMLIIIISRMIHGMGNSTINIAQTTMFADILPPDRFAEGIGYSGLFNSLSTAIGPAIGIVLIGISSSLTFTSMFVLILISYFLIDTMRYEKDPEYIAKAAQEDQDSAGEPAGKGIWLYFEKKALPAAAIMFIIAVASASITNFIALYAKTIGLAGVGAYYTYKAIFMIITRMTSGKLSAKLGVYRTIMFGIILSGIGYFLLATVQSQFMLYVCAMFDGLGGGFSYPSLSVLTLNGVPRKRRGIANSTYLVAWDLGVGVGASIWGRMIDMTGLYPVIFTGSGIIMAVNLLLTVYLSKKYPSAQV